MQLGIVYAPFLNVMYLGIRGHGAFDQEKRLRVSSTEQLDQALVATGFPYDRSNVQELVARVQIIIEHCADLRRNGAASLDLCSVANGTVDAYMETVMPWDLAAGLVIALEAGAKYVNPGAERQPAEYLDVKNLVIATPGILNELLNLSLG
jgi:myo-inositol-1(or 4)-monophosphatase